MEGSPCQTLPIINYHAISTAHRPRIEPNTIDERKKGNEIIVNDTLLYSQTGAQQNHHQRSFDQQMMGADVEIWNQTSGEVQGILEKRIRIVGGSGAGHHKTPHNQLTRAHRVHRDSTDNQGTCMGLAQVLFIYVIFVQLGLIVGLITK